MIDDEISEGREAVVDNSEDSTEASKHLQKVVDPDEAVVTGLGSEVILLHHLLLMIMIIVTKMMMTTIIIINTIIGGVLT